LIQEPPYLIRKTTDDDTSLEGNARFEGYIVDLLEQVAARAGFSYNIKMVEDDKYGTLLDGNRWNGMIGEVLDSVSNQTFQMITILQETSGVSYRCTWRI